MALFIMPAEGTITSGFRSPDRSDHHGIDIASSGTVSILASAAGTVSRSYFSSSYGEVVFIKHSLNGVQYESVYAHMREGSRTVSVGQTVSQGQRIGYMGNTGDSSGQHLHFELHKPEWNSAKSYAVDPLSYIGKSSGTEIYGIAVDNISLSKAQELVPPLQKRYAYILAADLIYGTSDGTKYKFVIKNINHKQAVEMVPRVQNLTVAQVPNYNKTLAYGTQVGPSPITDTTAYEIHVTGLSLSDAQVLVPIFQKEFAGIVLAQRVRGVSKGNGYYKVVLEGFTLVQAQTVRNEIAVANPDVPNDNIYGYKIG